VHHTTQKTYKRKPVGLLRFYVFWRVLKIITPSFPSCSRLLDSVGLSYVAAANDVTLLQIIIASNEGFLRLEIYATAGEKGVSKKNPLIKTIQWITIQDEE